MTRYMESGYLLLETIFCLLLIIYILIRILEILCHLSCFAVNIRAIDNVHLIRPITRLWLRYRFGAATLHASINFHHTWNTLTQIAKTVGPMPIRHRSDTCVSDRYQIHIDPTIFVIWEVTSSAFSRSQPHFWHFDTQTTTDFDGNLGPDTADKKTYQC